MDKNLSADMLRFRQGVFFALAGAVFFSAKSIVIKFLYGYGIDATLTIGLRLLFALPFFAAVAFFQAAKVRTGTLKKLTRKNIFQLIILGFLGYYLSSFLDIAGLKYISVSLERLILLLSPTFVLLISALFLKKPVQKIQLISLALSYLGVLAVFLQDFQAEGSHIFLGSALVLGSALSYSVYIIGAGELLRTLGATRLTAYAMSISAFFGIAQMIFVHGTDWLVQPLPVYGWSLVHAVFNTVIPTFFIMWSVERVGASVSTQLGLVGPVSLLFLAWWFLGDPITFWDSVGTVLVLAGAYLLGSRKKL